MKYVVSWNTRASGSASELEAAQKHLLALFQKWHAPDSVKFLQFLIRASDAGGYAVVETDDIAQLKRAATIFAVNEFRIEPVLDIMDAVATDVDAIAWRDSVSK